MKLSQSTVHSPQSTVRGQRQSAFTLMEVMIAIAVFCVGVFAILGLVASVMRGARLLDKPMVDAGVVASEIQTNSMVEVRGVSGPLSDYLGDAYKNYYYAYDISEVKSNHLYQADVAVTSDTQGHPIISKMSVLYFVPNSPPGSMDSGYMNTMQH